MIGFAKELNEIFKSSITILNVEISAGVCNE